MGEGMKDYSMLLAVERGDEAADLAAWLRRQGFAVSFVAQPETMGAAETLSAAVAGSAALKGLVLVAREWVRAHRTRISVEMGNGDSFEVEGTTDVEDLIELLRESDRDDPPQVSPDKPADG
jgi:hypothetical protein